MKAPVSWLKKYVDFDATPDELQKLLTSRGLEVGSYEVLGQDIQNVVVGKILSIEKHPDSDHLVVCQMDLGEEAPVQIVTGAPNVKEGDYVPAAKHGSTLPGGVHIKKGKLRGVISCGMLCSGGELGITEEDFPGAGVDGILILDKPYVCGTDIKEILGLTDVVLDAEPTPNRPDQMSIIGIAREIAAGLGKQLTIPEAHVAGSGGHITDSVKVDVLAPDLCPRYMARTVVDIHIAPSPKWMQSCLKAAGMRAINNIVDITNFVMLETGQPMHAFDLACVRDSHIVVRRALEGEKTTTLDGKEETLSGDMLVIADTSNAVGIAGIMGGENSEITESTKTVLFESAKFKGSNIRHSAKALGMMTEASQRFCKGIDVEGTEYALERACALVEELGAGRVERGTIDFLGQEIARKHIIARPEKINALVALDVPGERMKEILDSLDMPTVIMADGRLDIEIPHFRDDMEGEADVAEEIARVEGYDKIPLTLMKGELIRGKLTDRQRFVEQLRNSFALTFYEIYTYSFTGPAAYDKLMLAADSPLRNSVKLMNPFGEDNSLLRTTAATGMLPVLATNAKRKVHDLRFFELTNLQTPTMPGKIPDERKVLALGMWGQLESYFTLKGVLERFFKAQNIVDIQYKAGGPEYLHPGRKAEIYIDGRLAGFAGEVHPEVSANFEIPDSARALYAQLDVEALYEARREEARFKPLPKYPAVDRDIAIIVGVDSPWSDIQEAVKQSGGKFVREAALFDVYKGEGIPKGSRSLAFTVTFCADDRTLTDEDVNKSMDKILAALEKQFGAKRRA